jgi:hypothetical protein
MRTHWTHSFEPYFALSADALLDLPRFDEFYRGFGFDKAELFAALFASPAPEWLLAHLPRAYVVARGRSAGPDLPTTRARFLPVIDKFLRDAARLEPCDAAPGRCWCSGGGEQWPAGLSRAELALPDDLSACARVE